MNGVRSEASRGGLSLNEAPLKTRLLHYLLSSGTAPRIAFETIVRHRTKNMMREYKCSAEQSVEEADKTHSASSGAAPYLDDDETEVD